MKNKKNIIFILISVIIMLFLILKVIPVIVLNLVDNKNPNIEKSEINFQYNIQDLLKYAQFTEEYEEEITIEKQSKLPYIAKGNPYLVDIKLANKNQQSNYKIEWGIVDGNRGEEAIEDNKTIEIILKNEGLNTYYINIKKDGEIIENYQDEIYYIEPYQKQYLDELQDNGITTHFAHGWDNIGHINLLKYIGIHNIRDDIMITTIFKKDGSENYDTYDKWIPVLKENKIDLLGILNTNPQSGLFGSDHKISDEQEVKKFGNYVTKILDRYPILNAVQVINEPNGYYNNDNDVYWYVKTIEEVEQKINENNKDIKILVGATSTSEDTSDGKLLSEEFFRKLFNYENKYQYISSHFYDQSNKGLLNTRFRNLENKHKNLINEYGGFTKLAIAEFGDTTFKSGSTEEQQANRLVQQLVISYQNKNQYNYIYNFKDYGTDENRAEDNYGIVSKNYTPKLAYYAIKTFNENINGSEYIGTLNIVEGLEAHVYNKDGKPKIIAWVSNNKNNIEIDYESFVAKDIYGNEIENNNGKLIITTSPIYLDNISKKYFYQAISDTTIEEYKNFEEKFSKQLEKIQNIKQELQDMKQQMEKIRNVEDKIEEQTTLQLMQKHYQLGNKIIALYKNKELEIEKVTLSSILDELNDIGDSYEDLVTVTATTRNANIELAKDLINEVENIIQTNNDLEIIYPTKILKFSKDYQEKAEYINSVEEENDIKTGLIVSKNLHSIYLSSWAKEFCDIYIDEYLKNNVIAETYSQKELTNQDVIVTLNIGNDTKILNNDGSKKYTFTENGEFTFEYERRGRKLKQTVKVDNIDKQVPIINGIDNGHIYKEAVKPVIEDTNLENIKLIQNGTIIENYLNKEELKEIGTYRIEASDKAGNKTIVEFEIIDNISNEYIIEENNVKNIIVNTTIEQFQQNIQIQTKYDIFREEKKLEEKDIIATGDKIQLENGNQYSLIVRGDMNQDGKVTVIDLVLLKQQIIKEVILNDFTQIACDIDFNGIIDSRDVIKLRNLILGN